mgnify:CR=1 FL=1
MKIGDSVLVRRSIEFVRLSTAYHLPWCRCGRCYQPYEWVIIETQEQLEKLRECA